jgi:hypothetical protein
MVPDCPRMGETDMQLKGTGEVIPDLTKKVK